MDSSDKNILVFGCGGHARHVTDIIKKQGLYKIKGYVDQISVSKSFLGCSVYSEREIFDGVVSFSNAAVAIGDNFVRQRVSVKIINNFPNAKFPPLIDPTSIIADSVVFGQGTVFMAGGIGNTFSQVGDFCVLNTGSILGHDCIMRNASSLGPSATIGGTTRIGSLSHIGLGASVVNDIDIGKNVVLGAGGTAVSCLDDNALYLGVPAKLAKRRGEEDRRLSPARQPDQGP